MKRLMLSVLLCFALYFLPAARAEGGVFVDGDVYHATPLCAASRLDAEEYARLSALAEGDGDSAGAAATLLDAYYRKLPASDARQWGFLPCQVCVQDDVGYGGPCAVERGGTAVLRVPDRWIAEQERFDVFGTAGDDILEGEDADRELARILHGDAYVAFLEAVTRDGSAEGDALCPCVYPDDGLLALHARHIGGAWYLTFRPDGAGRRRMKSEGRLDADLLLEGGAIRWEGDALTRVSWGLHWEDTLDLPLGAIDGTPTLSGGYENLSVALFREMDANILVIRESPGDAAWLGAMLTLDDALAADGLTGYMDGGDAVYVCALTDVEADALKAGAFPRLIHPGCATGEAAEYDGWDSGYDYTVFFRDGALYVTNNADEACRPVTVHLWSEAADNDSARRLDAVPLGGTVRVYSAGDVDYRSNGEGGLTAWASLTLGDGGECVSNYDRAVWIDGRLDRVDMSAGDAAALNDEGDVAKTEPLPAPGRDLSFLSDYVDAEQVGDWYLACVAKTDEGRFKDATRNDTAEWRLLDGEGNALAEGLRWWPEEDWPLQPRPFEGFEDGVNTAVIRVGQKYGLIDRSGKIVAEPKYDSLFGFLPGDTSTPAELDGKWGTIDESGEVVVPFRYEVFSRFEGGCTVAKRGGKYCLLGEDGSELLPAEYGMIWLEDGAAYGFARKGAKCMLFDRAGHILSEREMGKDSWIYCYADAAPPFEWYDGRTETHGYCDPDGADVPGGPWEDASPFWGDSDAALVRTGDRWGAIRRDGSYAVEPVYAQLLGFSEGLCPAQDEGGLWGYLDEAGDVAIPFRYGDAGGFINGCADACPAERADLHGLIDRTGRWVIEPLYGERVEVGADGVAVGIGEGVMDCYRLTDGGAERVGSIDTQHRDRSGLLPNEDGDRLAALDGAPTLSARVSEDRLPHLDGPQQLYPLFAAVVQALYPKDTTCDWGWSSRIHDGNPTLTCTGTATAWQRLSDGDADIIFVPAPNADAPVWATLAARGQQPEFTPLCRDALVFVVNAENPTEDISLQELKEIYAGRIAAWDALGANGLGDIIAYQSGAGTYENDTREAFERLCAFDDLADPPEGVTGYDGFDGYTYIGPADYRNLPNAVGYALRGDCRELLEGGEIRLLSVDGVAPTDENLASGAYPFAETLYAVRLKGNDNPNVLALLEWLRGEQGAELARKAGFAAVG